MSADINPIFTLNLSRVDRTRRCVSVQVQGSLVRDEVDLHLRALDPSVIMPLRPLTTSRSESEAGTISS